MAFGGVAIGSINAQLAAKVVGINKRMGSICAAAAIALMIGKNVAIVGVLLMTSVTSNIINVRLIINSKLGMLCKNCR